MTPEELSKAQDEMLAQASATGKPSLWGRFNRFLWPDCSTCAGWRGVVIGLATATLICISIHGYI